MHADWIDDILAVAETGSFHAAAERRRVSQSAFSRRLQTIEAHLRASLFDRAARPARLLPHVIAQADRLKALSTEMALLRETLRSGPQGVRRRVVLAGLHAITTTLGPTLIDRLEPFDVDVRLRSDNRDECMAMLMTRRADYAMVYETTAAQSLPGREFLDIVEVGRETLTPVFASAHLGRLNAAFEAGELPVIAYPPDVFLGMVQEDRVFPAIARQCRPRRKLETALTSAALTCAASGVGVAWVPLALARSDVDSGALTILSDTLPAVDLSVVVARLASHARNADPLWSTLALQPG